MVIMIPVGSFSKSDASVNLRYYYYLTPYGSDTVLKQIIEQTALTRIKGQRNQTQYLV